MKPKDILRSLRLSAKSYYKDFLADASLNDLNIRLVQEITKYDPQSAFEFGCGQGKIMSLLEKSGIKASGMDISAPAVKVCRQQFLNVIQGTENDFAKINEHDIAYTCSVLDHIENIEQTIIELKRIARKAVIVAETNDAPAKFYYPHDYESIGFVKLDYEWQSPPRPKGDGARYHIWKHEKT